MLEHRRVSSLIFCKEFDCLLENIERISQGEETVEVKRKIKFSHGSELILDIRIEALAVVCR